MRFFTAWTKIRVLLLNNGPTVGPRFSLGNCLRRSALVAADVALASVAWTSTKGASASRSATSAAATEGLNNSRSLVAPAEPV